MAAEVTIVVIPSDTEAGTFNIFQFIYDINGNPQPDPFLLESNVPESNFISGYTVIVDDMAYGVRLVSNDDRGFGCVTTPIDHFFSNIQISNNFLISDGGISITGITFGLISLDPLPYQNATVFISLNTGTTVQDTITVGIANNEEINTLSYQITVRDSDNILPFTNVDLITARSGAEVSFTGATLSPNRQFRVLLDSFTPLPTPSVTPSISASPGLSPSVTPTITPSISISASPGLSPSVTPTITPTITVTPSRTTSPSFTPSKTPTPTITPTPTPPNSSVVMITNTTGAFDISDVTVDGISVFDLSIPFPIPPGSQSVGLTDQLGVSTTVEVTLSDISIGENITVMGGGMNCLPTNNTNVLSFSSINTTNGITVTYGAGSC